jgi:DNA-binding MarR family transcriptional regulator
MGTLAAMAAPRWLDDDEQRAWRSYRRMKTLVDAATARDLMADSALSASDYDVLSTLTEAEGHRWRAGDLAARLLWSTSRLSHQVARMERRGLVAREESRHDRRAAVVALTPAGLETIEQAAPAHIASVRRHFVDVLTSAELATLAKLAAKVVEHHEAPAN